MSLLIAIVIGAAVGSIAGYVLLDNFDFLLLSALMGVVGSIIGLAVYYFGLKDVSDTSLFSLPATLCSIIGAMVTVLLFCGLHKVTPKHVAHQGSVDEKGPGPEEIEES